MQKSNIVVGILTVLLGITILYFSRDMGMFDDYGVPGERFWPFGLALLFILLGVLQWIEVIIQRIKKHESIIVTLMSPAILRAYVVAVVMFVYAAALYYFGFIVASIVLVPAIMWMMGERRIQYLIIAPICIVAAVYLFFEVIFNSPLPISIFYD